MSTLSIKDLPNKEAIPYSLLLLADPDRQTIDSYLKNGCLRVAYAAEQLIGCYALAAIDTKTWEIKNIAIDPSYQGKGFGQVLLKDAIQFARSSGATRLRICTGNSSIAQLYLYQKAGFEISEIRKNHFIDNYPAPIFENGIQCKHQLVLEQNLAPHV